MYIYIWHFYSIEQTNTSQAIHITISFPWLGFKWDHAFTPQKKTSNQMGRERDIQVTGEGRPASAKLIWQPPQRRSTSPARDLGKGMSCVHGRGWGWWCSRNVRRSRIASDFSITMLPKLFNSKPRHDFLYKKIKILHVLLF